MAVVGVSVEGLAAEDESFFAGAYDADFDAEFVALVCLAFADTFYFWGINAIEFVLAVSLLSQ